MTGPVAWFPLMPVPFPGPVRIYRDGSKEMELEKEMPLQNEKRVLRQK
jgi:hypothetical protein